MSSELYEKAKQKVKKKKKFHKNLQSYIVWCAILLFINLFIARGYLWSLWVILFWGIGILKEGIDTYGSPFGGDNWEKREIEKEIEKMKSLDDGSDTPTIEQQSDRPQKSERQNRWEEDELV